MRSVEVNLLRGYIRRSSRSCNAEIPYVELPDLVIIYRTYHAESEYQNQFPEHMRTCWPPQNHLLKHL
jgi:hypothetical protein